jgi:hypothetical protein
MRTRIARVHNQDSQLLDQDSNHYSFRIRVGVNMLVLLEERKSHLLKKQEISNYGNKHRTKMMLLFFPLISRGLVSANN